MLINVRLERFKEIKKDKNTANDGIGMKNKV